ncbi:hypothetical protein N656DRAFT_768156 [Canariomyces notabilis]|uniref:NACHT domain-containing protein n=1 Tax=Canariomyces notabilis TaxID=2074819 RepID=A0AAN6TEZ8_9PEZI|nr:hypothetical protein N656DRAFT_768156 [Canariomyces arenarius]
MSGLEPIAALSLACNMLQVIDVAYKTIHTVRQVYQNGELDSGLTHHATHLEDLSKRIRTATMPTTTTKTPSTTSSSTARGAARGATQPRPTDRDMHLLELSNRCLKAIWDLREEVEFLKGPDTKSKLVAILKTATKTVWRQRRLERLEKDMLDAERLLQTGLLTRVFEHAEKAAGGLEKLDSGMRSLVDEYRAGRLEAAGLVRGEADRMRKNLTSQIKGSTQAVNRHTTQETARAETSLKTHITQATAQVQMSLKTRISAVARSAEERAQDARLEARRERLLRSLKFDRMNERKNMVAESHPKTYQLVLTDGSDAGEPADVTESSKGDADHRWDSFSDWLRSTEPTYWISGKLGSGKTTLVKYPLGHPQTRSFLELWSPGAVLVSHFFWRPGTQIGSNASAKDTETDWSDQELQSTLLDVMAHYPKSMACFLDGLDEVLRTDGTLALLNVVDALKRPQGLQGKVKLCLGARREPLIEEKLWACPQLRLEDLNYTDLRRYAEDTIIIPPQYQISIPPGSKLYARNAEGYQVTFSSKMPLSRSQMRDWLVTELVAKAEGVFLWLCLTAKTVMEALWQGETVTDLQHRIDSLPTDLTQLYADMWARANGDSERPQHQKRAVLYFHLAIKPERMYKDRLSLTIGTTDGMANLIRYCDPDEPGFATRLVESCKAKMRDIEVRCAGLLKINPIPERNLPSMLQPWYGKEYCDLIPYAEEAPYPPLFEFVHRTAHDFLTDTVEGLKILRKYKISHWRLRQRFVAARLAACRLLRSAPAIKYCFLKEFVHREDYNSLRRHLASISRLLDTLPEGDEENAIGECYELLGFCEQLFESGQLFGDARTPAHDEDFQEVGPESDYFAYQTRYEVVVKRDNEFLLEAASINLNIWPLILAKVQSLELNTLTLSELLLHVCNITDFDQEDVFWARDLWDWNELHLEWEDGEYYSYRLGIDCRLRLARLLLERGADPSRKGPRRIYKHGDYGRTDQVHVLETPLKGLISSVWRLDRNTGIMDENLARYFIALIRLLMSNGADPAGEEFRVTYQVIDGRLFERPLGFESEAWRGKTPVGGIEDMWFVLAYPLSTILVRMLWNWKDRFPEIDTFLEAQDTSQDGKLGHVILMLRPARMCFVEAGEEREEGLAEELQWVARSAEGILSAHDLDSRSVPVPLEIQHALSRALDRRHPKAGEKSQASRRLFNVFQRAGMTSIYCGKWEDGCPYMSKYLLAN